MLQDKIIDYTLLADACKFYSFNDYTQVEVPWIVDSTIAGLTMPNNAVPFVMKDGSYLVGSAEQGFIQQTLLGNLDFGKYYFSVSPCFRNEKNDDTHSTWFMKLELFYASMNRVSISDAPWCMLQDASRFFEKMGVRDVTTVNVDTGLDLMSGDLEIGSYGFRRIGDLYIAFGTGAALPRLQLAIERNR